MFPPPPKYFPPLLLNYIVLHLVFRYFFGDVPGIEDWISNLIFPRNIFPLYYWLTWLDIPLHLGWCTRVGVKFHMEYFPQRFPLPPQPSTSETYLIRYSPTSWSVYQGGRFSFTRNISPIYASTVFWVVRFSDSAWRNMAMTHLFTWKKIR